MATHITLIRHGETAWNVTGRWQGHAFVPLNDEGRHQATRLAKHLLPVMDEITAIYSSDLVRASETAEIIAARLDKTVKIDVRLREIDMGEWQGLTGDEIRAWDGARYDQALNDASLPRPGGESWTQVTDRALAALDDITGRHTNEHVLVVSHGGTIRALLKQLGLLGTDHVRIGNTSQTRLLHNLSEAAPWTLDVLNVLTHLDAETSDSHER
jgi:broad specificity phosphatase PhoE